MKNKNLTTNADAQEAKAQHTKGEWKAEKGNIFCDDKRIAQTFISPEWDKRGKFIANNDIADANAERIAKAVNMHDELVKMIRYSVTLLNGDGADREMQDKMLELLKQAEQK